MHYPYSIPEMKFYFRLNDAILTNKQVIRFDELFESDWEVVCESHGYDAAVVFNGVTYPHAGDMQDGAWGFLFIYADGSFDSASSSCGKGAYLMFSGKNCLPKSEAILHKMEHGGCKTTFHTLSPHNE